MLLLLTISGDGTSDRIVDRLGSGVFRYNFDQLSQYKLRFGVDAFEIINPAGHRISSEDARSVFWWKAFSAVEHELDKFFVAEGKYIFFEIYNWFQDRGMVKGNSVRFHNRFGKISILSKARKHFNVPETVYTFGLLGEDIVPKNNRITKSLSSEPTSNGTVLFTTDVSNKSLDPAFPWFLQTKLTSRYDITCFLVNGNLFCFSRDRKMLSGLDWRAEQTFDPNVQEWEPYSLSEAETKALLELSAELGVEWGRYDFMLGEEGELVFLEFNANGQFVFLDFWEKHGIMDAVIEYLER